MIPKEELQVFKQLYLPYKAIVFDVGSRDEAIMPTGAGGNLIGVRK